MPYPAQIAFHGMPWSGPVARSILRRLDRLNALYPQATDWRVTVEPLAAAPGNRRYSTRLDVEVTGGSAVSTRGRSDDPLDAFEQAAQSARLRLSSSCSKDVPWPPVRRAP